MAWILTGESESGAILEALRRTQGLILTREDDATVYEFHPLFSDFLRARAEREFPTERLRALSMRAAGLLVERGEFEAAMHMYQRAETGPWPVCIRTLGRFEVVVDGVTLPTSGKSQRKPLELLKAMVAFGGEQISIDKLSDALWPDAEGERARSAFDTDLHRLRRLLGHREAIIVWDGKLTLNPIYCQVDIRAFERHLRTVETLLAANPSPDALEQAAAQLSDLYRHGLLPDEPEWPWLLARRDGYQRKFVRGLTAIAQALQTTGAGQRAIALYECAIEHNPLNEHLHRGLIVCHAALGHQAEALAAYLHCEELLACAFGVAPTCDTRALCEKFVGRR